MENGAVRLCAQYSFIVRVALLLLTATAACSGLETDLRPWPEATRELRVHLEQEPSAHEPGAQPCVAGWQALERYAERAYASLMTAPFESSGIEEQVAAVADLHRALIASGAAADDPLSAGLAAEVAREMRAAYDTIGAFAAAHRAVALLAEELAISHRRHASELAAAAEHAAAQFAAANAGLQTLADALTNELAALESELRMEAAGAGRARPDAALLASRRRAELAALMQEIRVEQARRAEPLAAMIRQGERFERYAQAASAWAIAQREAARAARTGRAHANFSLLLESVRELAAPRAATETPN